MSVVTLPLSWFDLQTNAGFSGMNWRPVEPQCLFHFIPGPQPRPHPAVPISLLIPWTPICLQTDLCLPVWSENHWSWGKDWNVSGSECGWYGPEVESHPKSQGHISGSCALGHSDQNSLHFWTYTLRSLFQSPFSDLSMGDFCQFLRFLAHLVSPAGCHSAVLL